MDYITVKEAGKKWGITDRRVAVLCKEGRIDGAIFMSRIWLIPKEAEKPIDARIKSRKYIGISRDRKNRGQ